MVQRWPEPFVTGAGFEPFIYPLNQSTKKLSAGYRGIRVESSLSDREYLRRKGRKGGDRKHRRKGKAREESARLKGNGRQ